MSIRKILLLNILCVGLALLAGSFSYANDYEYKKLDIQANVKMDGIIDVKETFLTNFLERRHGIIRIIPLNYSVEGKKFHLDISDVKVEGTKFTVSKNGGDLEIKIGDANQTVIGEKAYPIHYSVYGLIKNFSGMGYAELYWNFVGCDFDTNIDLVKAEIMLPKTNSFVSSDFLITVDGKEITVGSFAGKVDWSQGDRIMITYDKGLSAGEGITLAVKFPSDYFEFDHNKQESLLGYLKYKEDWFNFEEYGWFEKTLIFIVGFLIFSFGVKYISNNLVYKRNTPVKIGGDLGKKYPIIVQYNPPEGINSAEAGLLFNCRVDPVDITSLLYQWANNKFIFIDYQRKSNNSKKIKSITIVKKSDLPESYPYYEKDLFNNIFNGQKSKFIDKNTNLSMLFSLESLEDYGLRKHWLCRKEAPLIRNLIYFMLYLLLVYLSFHYFGWLGILFLVFFTPILFGVFFKQGNKIKMTEEGASLAAHVIGYAKFIKECDENVLKTFLKEDPLFIDKTLPYAVAFGMESLFFKKVTPLVSDMEKTWLTGNFISVGNIISFIKTDSLFVQSSGFLFNPFFFLGGGSSGDYDSSGGFSSGSSFGGGFSAGGGGGGGGSRSW